MSAGWQTAIFYQVHSFKLRYGLTTVSAVQEIDVAVTRNARKLQLKLIVRAHRHSTQPRTDLHLTAVATPGLTGFSVF